ncbi:hypothetical protein [Methylobacterium soli]|uniref:hypothetical protein n=1 Tax=Methylobacterium soli TaxID=553447 RepID=UPI0017803912|nr:hypothetical protein [Methylobacterium soli]GJE42831.1 hypothetical protein AEGHOMDF_2004 [Methylobacterium soli]
MDTRANSTIGSNPANAPVHRQGQDVDTVDQLSSVVLLGLALVGGAAAILLHWLIH